MQQTNHKKELMINPIQMYALANDNSVFAGLNARLASPLRLNWDIKSK